MANGDGARAGAGDNGNEGDVAAMVVDVVRSSST